MGMRDELKTMAEGFRWGRRPMVPRSAEPHTPPREDPVFPTDAIEGEIIVAQSDLEDCEQDLHE
jgi:hypothetical protein